MRKTTNSEQRENMMRIKKCLMMTVCILYFFGIAPGSYAGEDVDLTTSEYLPFTTEHAKNHGFCSEIVSTVIKKMGMNPVYTFYPWKRGQAALGDGEMWATFPYVKTREREQEYWFSAQPLFTSKISFFYHKDHLSNAVRWNTLEDLKSYKIGGVRGYWYQADFAKAGLNVEYTTHPEQSIKKLQAGRIQLFPVNDLVGWYLVEKHFAGSKNRFGTLEKPYDMVSDYLMVSKSYPNSEHLLKQFDEMFHKIKESGEYQNILKKHKIAD
jgi:polar amino acid transport system substrate-binding protein